MLPLSLTAIYVGGFAIVFAVLGLIWTRWQARAFDARYRNAEERAGRGKTPAVTTGG